MWAKNVSAHYTQKNVVYLLCLQVLVGWPYVLGVLLGPVVLPPWSTELVAPRLSSPHPIWAVWFLLLYVVGP